MRQYHLVANVASEVELNRVWDAIKKVDATYADLNHEITNTGGAEQSYTIQAGDNLSKVSELFYGNANKYMEIAKANGMAGCEQDSGRAGDQGSCFDLVLERISGKGATYLVAPFFTKPRVAIALSLSGTSGQQIRAGKCSPAGPVMLRDDNQKAEIETTSQSKQILQFLLELHSLRRSQRVLHRVDHGWVWVRVAKSDAIGDERLWVAGVVAGWGTVFADSAHALAAFPGVEKVRSLLGVVGRGYPLSGTM